MFTITLITTTTAAASIDTAEVDNEKNTDSGDGTSIVIWDRKRDGGFPGMFMSSSEEDPLHSFLPSLISFFLSFLRPDTYLFYCFSVSPEVKVLKSLVRNIVEPTRNLGHTDRALNKQQQQQQQQQHERHDLTPPTKTATYVPTPVTSAAGPAGGGQEGDEKERACEDCQ